MIELIKLQRSRCAILPLVLKGKWFDMIERGEKREEYRAIKPYWNKRLKVWKWQEPDEQLYWIVAFSRGYKKSSLFYEVTEVGERDWAGHLEWGEPPTPHYVIKLGCRVELTDSESTGAPSK